MAESIDRELIIYTKLHRPPLSADHLHRKNLLKKLDKGRSQTLSLVSAPAGYGKSTLVSCWLENCDTPSAWLSLDEKDNDLRLFLIYFVSMIKTIDKNACSKTMSMLRGAQFPVVSRLISVLKNEIDRVESDFIIVLDDYHLIRERLIHEVLTSLLNHPSSVMHIVMISRRDPPLPLFSMRAKGLAVEIRVQDLKFSLDDSKSFLQKITGKTVESSVVETLNKKTEGWVTGLRLAALSLMHRTDFESILTSLPAENRYVMDYVLKEVLAHLSPAVQECMLKISILGRFCAPLCERVCFPDQNPDLHEINSQEFLGLLSEANLFTIALDDDHTWFRYHHLVGSILKRQLKNRFTGEEIAQFYRSASAWFAANGYIEEALTYILEIDDFDTAAELVAIHRLDLMNREQWYRLDYWLKKFPDDYIGKHPSLLMSKAWIYQRQARYSKLFQVLALLDEKSLKRGVATVTLDSLEGEKEVLRSFNYFSTAQPLKAEASALKALDLLPVQSQSVRGFTYIILSVTLQMLGAREKGRQLIYTELQEADQKVPVYRTMLLVAECFSNWIAADLENMEPAATLLLKHGEKHGLPETITIGRYFLGIRHYERNELDRAEHFLRPATESMTAGELVVPSIVTYCQSSFAMSLVCQAQGREREAENLLKTVIGYMLESDNVDMLQTCQAFQAELHNAQGHLEGAKLWAKGYVPQPLVPAYRFYSPHLALPKVLLGQGSIESLAEADKLLSQTYRYFHNINSSRMLIHILALHALVCEKRNDRTGASKKLLEALKRAYPGELVRPFLDLGQQMRLLIAEVSLNQEPEGDLGQRIKQLFEDTTTASSVQESTEVPDNVLSQTDREKIQPLTNREIEVLNMLAKGGSNSEIAKQLYISSETVKRHLSTIYRKLAVKNRHQAIARSRSIGIL